MIKNFTLRKKIISCISALALLGSAQLSTSMPYAMEAVIEVEGAPVVDPFPLLADELKGPNKQFKIYKGDSLDKFPKADTIVAVKHDYFDRLADYIVTSHGAKLDKINNIYDKELSLLPNGILCDDACMPLTFSWDSITKKIDLAALSQLGNSVGAESQYYYENIQPNFNQEQNGEKYLSIFHGDNREIRVKPTYIGYNYDPNGSHPTNYKLDNGKNVVCDASGNALAVDQAGCTWDGDKLKFVKWKVAGSGDKKCVVARPNLFNLAVYNPPAPPPPDNSQKQNGSSSQSTSSSSSSGNKSDGMSTGAKVGVGVTATALVAAAAGETAVVVNRRRSKSAPQLNRTPADKRSVKKSAPAGVISAVAVPVGLEIRGKSETQTENEKSNKNDPKVKINVKPTNVQNNKNVQKYLTRKAKEKTDKTIKAVPKRKEANVKKDYKKDIAKQRIAQLPTL